MVLASLTVAIDGVDHSAAHAGETEPTGAPTAGSAGPSGAPPTAAGGSRLSSPVDPLGISGGPVGEPGSVVATLTVGTAPFGAAYDSATGDIYVANFGANTVSVISGATSAVIGSAVPVGDDPIGVAYDSENGDLYVTNFDSDTVSVISGATNTVIGSPISVDSYPNGIAFDPANGDLYVANEGADSVSVISGATNAVIGSAITVGGYPIGMAYDSGNGDVYVANYDSDTVSVISGATNAVVGSAITVGTDPARLAYDAGNGEVYVANDGSDSVSVISGATNAVVGSAITVGSAPVSVAYDDGNGFVYVANAGAESVSVVAGASNTVDGSAVTVGNSPVALAFDSATGDVFVSNEGAGTVSVISTALMLGAPTPSLLGQAEIAGSTGAGLTIPSVAYPTGVAYDTENGDVYVVNYDDDSVTVVNGSTNAVVGSPITVGGYPISIAYDSENGELYVTSYYGGSVVVISGVTNTVVGSAIAVGDYPIGVAYDSGNGELYVANSGANSVSVINGATNTVVGSAITVGSGPVGVEYDGANGDVYVTNGGTDTVSVISGASNAVVGTAITVGGSPQGAAYDSANGYLYVANSDSNSVSVIDGATNAVVGSAIPVGSDPNSAVFDSANGNVYVTNDGTSSVSVIRTTTGAVAETLSAGDSPYDVAYDSGNGNVYVTNYGSETVTVYATLKAEQTGPGPVLDAGQTLLVSAPLVGEGSGQLVLTAYSTSQSGLNCTADPLGITAVSAACLGVASGSYEVMLLLTDSAGSSVEASLTVTVLEALTISPVTASPAHLDQGQQTILSTGGGVGGAPPYTYTWSGLPTGCVSVNAPTMACTPDSSAIVYVTVADGNGFTVSAVPVELSVFPDPAAGTLSASPASVDVGQTTTISGTLTSPGGGMDTYAWTGLPGGVGCASVDALSVSCTPSSAGSYSIALNVTDVYGYTASSASLILVVDPALGPATIDASASTVSVGRAVFLTANVTGGTGEYTYTWSGLPTGCSPAGTAGLLCEPEVAGAFSVTVAVVDGNGVSETSSPLMLKVSADPAVGPLSASPVSVDVGQSTTITGSVTNVGSGTDSYVWTGLPGGSGCASVDQLTLSCTPSSAGTFGVSLSVMDSNGYTSTSPTLVLLVDPALGTATVKASASTVSVGQTVLFSVSESGGSGEYTYAWSNLPTGCATADSAEIACTPTSASGTGYEVSVVVTDSNGASATATASSTFSVTAATSSSTPVSGTEWAALGLAIAAIGISAGTAVGLLRRGQKPPPASGTGPASPAPPGDGTTGR